MGQPLKNIQYIALICPAEKLRYSNKIMLPKVKIDIVKNPLV
jgi:hypothetical protein